MQHNSLGEENKKLTQQFHLAQQSDRYSRIFSIEENKKRFQQYHLTAQAELYSITSCAKKIKSLPNNII